MKTLLYCCIPLLIWAKSASAIDANTALKIQGNYHFDEASGTNAADATGTHNGTLVGAIWTPGVNGSGLQFDGTSAYVDIANSFTTVANGGITVSAWIKPGTNPLGEIFAVGAHSDTAGYHQFYLQPNEVHWQFSTGTSTVNLTFPWEWTSGTWYHLAVAHDYAAKTVTFYINGDIAEKLSHVENVLPVTAKKGYIGALRPGYHYYAGVIDELRVHNKALTQSDILFLMNNEAAYYVATNGNNSNSGDADHPFLTIAKGISLLTPGRTLFIKAGSYPEKFKNNIPPGSDWLQPVLIRSFPGDAVTIKPARTVPAAARVFELRSYTGGGSEQFIVLDGLCLDGSNLDYNGIKILSPARSLSIVNCEIVNAPDSGILLINMPVSGTSNDWLNDISIINCTIHNNGTVNGSHGIYIGSMDKSLPASRNILIEGCNIYNNYGCAIRNDGTDDSTIIGNRLHHNGLMTDVNAAQLVGSNLIFANNIVYNNPFGISLEKGSVNVFNNTIYGNLGHGMTNTNTASVLHVANNIVYKNGRQGIALKTSGSSGSEVDNNIAAGNPEGDITELTPGANWHNNFSNTEPGLINVFTDNYHLVSTGSAVKVSTAHLLLDEDVDLLKRSAGGGAFEAYPDLGAAEYIDGYSEPLPNFPPQANAGADRWASFNAGSASVILSGSGTDEIASPALNWEVVRQPAAALPTINLGPETHTVFSATTVPTYQKFCSARDATVTFNQVGTYMLHLVANDGVQTAHDLAVVGVYPAFTQGQTFRLEFEDMLVDKYDIIGSGSASFASGGAYVAIKNTEETTNLDQIYGVFPGQDGYYDIKIGYFDESDGRSTSRFKVVRGDHALFDQISYDWTFDKDLPGSAPNATTAATTSVAHVYLKQNDHLLIDGYGTTADVNPAAVPPTDERAALDYVEFTPTAQAPDGAEARWAFNEGAGAIAANSFSAYHTASVQGCTWIASGSGTALHFNGTNNYLTNSTPISSGTNTGITVTAWVKVPSFTPLRTIFSLGQNVSGKIGFHRLDLHNATIRWEYSPGTTSTSRITIPIGLVFPDIWYHIAITHDYAAKQVKYYLNGALKQTVSHTDSVVPIENRTSMIGGTLPSGLYPFNGDMDEVRVYTRVLNQDQITAVSLDR